MNLCTDYTARMMQMRMRHKSPHFWFAAGSRSNLAKTKLKNGLALVAKACNLPRERKCCVWHIINPRCACAARVTVVGSVCPSVCVSVTFDLPSRMSNRAINRRAY